MSIETEINTIAIIGGTGKEGKGLAYRWVKAGYKVIIGSRSAEKAQTAVMELAEKLTKKELELLTGLKVKTERLYVNRNWLS